MQLNTNNYIVIKGINMQVIRESFDDTMAAIVDRLNNEKFNNMQEESESLAWKQQYRLNFEEELVDTVSLEDELAEATAVLILTSNNKIKISNQEVNWTKSRTTITPNLNSIPIKGKLKRALIAKLVDFSKYTEVTLYNKPFFKYNFQYGAMSIDFFTDNLGKLSGFFKVRGTAANNKKHTIKRVKTYTNEVESKLNGDAFPEVELNMLEQALELVEDLETLCYKSDNIARAVAKRTDLQIDRIKELEAEILQLKEEAK